MRQERLPQTEQRRAWARFVLGQAQMFGAVVSFILLVEVGAKPATVWACLLTTALTLTSRLLFHRR